MTSGGNNFNHFAENQLTKFNGGDTGDFNDVAGEREMAPKCGSLPRDAGDLVGLHLGVDIVHAYIRHMTYDIVTQTLHSDVD